MGLFREHILLEVDYKKGLVIFGMPANEDELMEAEYELLRDAEDMKKEMNKGREYK